MAKAIEKPAAKKKIVVDKDLCIGCGACEATAGEYFRLEDGTSTVIKDYDEKDKDIIDQAISGCPVGAISIVEE